MITLENRPIFAVLDTANGKEHVPVVAWIIVPNSIHPQALVIPPKDVTGYGSSLAFADNLAGFVRLEYIEPQSRIVAPIPVTRNSGTQSFIACPNGKGGEHNVHEWKMWKVALAIEKEGVEALSYRRWTQGSDMTRDDIRAIVLLFAEYGLCTRPSARKTTELLPGVQYAHFIALVARITKGVPPTQLAQ